jgi:hypothetical protein
MKKVLVLFLVIGFLLGTFAAIEELHEENFVSEHIDFTDDDSLEDGGDNPAPCGGGNGGGGIPG